MRIPGQIVSLQRFVTIRAAVPEDCRDSISRSGMRKACAPKIRMRENGRRLKSAMSGQSSECCELDISVQAVMRYEEGADGLKKEEYRSIELNGREMH